MSTDLWQAYFSYPQLPNPAKLSLHIAEPNPRAQFEANRTKKRTCVSWIINVIFLSKIMSHSSVITLK